MSGEAPTAPHPEPVSEPLAVRLARRTGWRGAALVAGLGLATAAAYPPLYLVVGLFGYAGLVWRLDACRSWRGAFATGWLFAFAQHVGGLYWISNALLVDGATYGWLIPFAAAGLPAVFAVYGGLAALAYRALALPGAGRIVLFAAVWCMAEWVRGHALTGFPWNLPATVWAFSDALMQPAAVFGPYGLSLLTLLVAAAPAGLAGAGTMGGTMAGSMAGGRGGRAVLAVAVAAVVAGLPAWGWHRLATAAPAFVPGQVVRVVQGNVPQRDKWRRELMGGHIRRYMELSVAPVAEVVAPGLTPGTPPTAVVWPETAMPLFLNERPEAQRALAAVAPPDGTLLVGAPATGTDGQGLFNSLFAIGRTGVQARYDKAHLVPFGEYMPFAEWLPIGPLIHFNSNFSAGSGPATLSVPGLPPFSPLICYEVIFPGDVVGAGASLPALLLNLTNDAWYGDSAGPPQHLVASRMRAVERGLPLVRAANTGISAVVDPWGRVLARLPLGVAGAIDSRVPRPLPGLTPYSRWGEAGFLILIGFFLFLSQLPRVFRTVSR